MTTAAVPPSPSRPGNPKPASADGPKLDRLLAAHDGPAVAVDANGQVLARNDAGLPLAEALDADGPDELRTSLRIVLSRGGGPLGALDLPTAESPRILEAEALPLGAGVFALLARDVTLERNLRAALIDSRQRFKDLVEASCDFAWEVGPNGTFTYVSPNGALGYPAAELGGQAPKILGPRDGRDLTGLFAPRHQVVEEEVWVTRADGTAACLEVTAVPLTEPGKGWVGARGICRDVTEERDRDAALARAHQREKILAGVVAAVRDEVDPQDMLDVAAIGLVRALQADGVRIYRADADGHQFAVSEHGPSDLAEALDAAIAETAPDRPVRDVEIGPARALVTATSYRHEINGGLCLWRTDGAAWSDDARLVTADVANQLGIALEQYANHERILRLSRTDGLTGLLNRRALFEEELPRRLARQQLPGRTGALVYIDLDNFKLVNDVHGHQRGDEALLAVRDILNCHTRASDLVARLGGDEFVLWLDRIAAEVVESRVEDLQVSAQELRAFSGSDEFPLGFSIGVGIYDPTVGEPMDSLVARADAAMYAVKKRCKGGIEISLPPTAADIDGGGTP